MSAACTGWASTPSALPRCGVVSSSGIRGFFCLKIGWWVSLICEHASQNSPTSLTSVSRGSGSTQQFVVGGNSRVKLGRILETHRHAVFRDLQIVFDTAASSWTGSSNQDIAFSGAYAEVPQCAITSRYEMNVR